MSQDEYIRGTPCELIAISQGLAKRNKHSAPNHHPIQAFNEMDVVQEIEKLEEYVFSNVLWIEWAGGVAYRKATGRVWKEAFEQ